MDHHHSHALSSKKAKSLKLIKQSRGTIDRVTAMIESDNYCPEIIQQVDSVIGLLRSARRELLEGHLNTCAFDHMHADKDSAIKELVKLYNFTN